MPLKDAKFGDIMACDGKGKASGLIKLMSGGNISHVAFIMSPTQLIESTFMDDMTEGNGVANESIDQFIERYPGNLWHLSLKEPIENVVDSYEYAMNFVGTPYDMVQAAKSALDILLDNVEDFNALYCSELCGAIYQFANVLPESMNMSEVTPVDLCRLKKFQWQRCIKGTGSISRFNTINVEDFDEY